MMWLARDEDGEYGVYKGAQPTKETDGCYWDEAADCAWIFSMDAELFHKITRTRLRKGQCIELASIEFIKKEK